MTTLTRRGFGPLLLAGGAAALAAARPGSALAATRREIDADVAAAMVRLRSLPNLASRLLRRDQPWIRHFEFARAAAAHKVQHVGNEAGLPSLADIERLMAA